MRASSSGQTAPALPELFTWNWNYLKHDYRIGDNNYFISFSIKVHYSKGIMVFVVGESKLR